LLKDYDYHKIKFTMTKNFYKLKLEELELFQRSFRRIDSLFTNYTNENISLITNDFFLYFRKRQNYWGKYKDYWHFLESLQNFQININYLNPPYSLKNLNPFY